LFTFSKVLQHYATFGNISHKIQQKPAFLRKFRFIYRIKVEFYHLVQLIAMNPVRNLRVLADILPLFEISNGVNLTVKN